jgi:saccharopine dehydrogenase (NAD+, L-lysine-forming)
MDRAATFGVIGGTGSTGRAVASELQQSTGKSILIAGRNLSKAEAVAAQLGGTVSPTIVDVGDPRSLDAFCSRCSIVVNCAGPVCELQDAVAQAAYRTRTHYVDVAGLTFVRERMVAKHQEIAGLGLSFVISAGWMPGLCELLPAYGHALATANMDSVYSITVYFGDSGEWSANALHDAAWYLHNAGLRGPRYVRNGNWLRAQSSAAFRKKEFGSALGRCRFAMMVTPELAELSKELKDCDVYGYAYMARPHTVLIGALVALLPLPRHLAVPLLRSAMRSDSFPVGGFVVVHIEGRKEGKNVSQTVQLIYDKHRDYWINGLVPTTVARLIAEGGSVKTGVRFLADAVDPIAFMQELRRAGVNQTDSSV